MVDGLWYQCDVQNKYDLSGYSVCDISQDKNSVLLTLGPNISRNYSVLGFTVWVRVSGTSDDVSKRVTINFY